LVLIPFIFLGFQLFTYYLLVFSADRRARYIEDMLPDVLQTTSANLRAGMPLPIAFWQSAPKEVGPMAEEIHRVSSEIFAGKSFVEAISEMSERVNSTILRRVASLIAEGVRGGGNIADLLDSIAENLRNMKNIREESSAKVKGYYASILFGIAIGTPLLLALSLNLISSIYSMSTQFREYQIPLSAITKVPLASLIIGFIQGGGKIDLSILEIYAYLVIASSSIFGGILVSVVIHGKEIKFLKYSLPLLLLSLVLFFVFRTIITSLVGFFI
ncbi:MAG: type II secretion system F family protein, partial [Candidatus Nanoarchaeia archaeon]|nr:type II secretion system F family protein [Candidatus Haiyanarchaeum thermophilum]